MGWHMKLVICVQLAYVSVCLTQQSVVREWTSFDVQLTSEDGQESRRSLEPYEIRPWLMYKDRVFVTMRGLGWEYNYLAYLDLTDNSTSPLLRPYPSYENQQLKILHDLVRVDRCDRLWVLSVIDDSRKQNIIVIDIKTDSILRNITIPDLYFSSDMAVDDFDCDNEYVYISTPDGVWTYSWGEDDSWRHISDYITSMLLAPNSIIYFNVFEDLTPTVYYMSTTHLRDKSNKTSDIRELRRSWKLDVRLYSSALDAKSDVLYYFTYGKAIHAVPCWTSVRCSLNCQDVSIDDPTQNTRLRYITVDENGYLWAFTKSLDGEKYKFRLSSVDVKSRCIESNDNDTTNTSTDEELNPDDDEI